MKCPPKIHKIYHKRQQTTNTNDQQLAGSLGIIVQCQQPPVLVSGTNQQAEKLLWRDSVGTTDHQPVVCWYNAHQPGYHVMSVRVTASFDIPLHFNPFIVVVVLCCAVLLCCCLLVLCSEVKRLELVCRYDDDQSLHTPDTETTATPTTLLIGTMGSYAQ